MSLITAYKDPSHKVTSLVAPPFTRGVLSLQHFVLILESAPVDVSTFVKDEIWPLLVGHVNDAHEEFDKAQTIIHQINNELDSDFQSLVVKEKTANDELSDTTALLCGIDESIKVKKEEKRGIQQQLSKENDNLSNARSFLEDKKEELKREETARNVQAGFTGPTILFATFLGALAGPIGAIAAGSAAGAAMGVGLAALQKDVENAETAVSGASSRVESTKRRLKNKNDELNNLEAELRAKEGEKQDKSKKVKSIKEHKHQIKTLQERLARVNVAIKNCTTFVDTTATRTKMMADEANHLLPDIQAMLGPLRAIACDLGQVSVSNSRLLSGGFNMRAIGNKIKMISAAREEHDSDF